MNPEDLQDPTAMLDRDDLENLARNVRSIVDVRDRKYGLPPRTYPHCFVGTEAVAAMIVAGIAASEEDAVHIGNLLLDAGVFQHVQKEHRFKNEYLFYRFAAAGAPGDPGPSPEGRSVSWADFIPAPGPVRGRKPDETLQPAIPEPDPELAAMTQDDLDTKGVAPLDEHNAKLLDHVHPRNWDDPAPRDFYNLVVIGAGAGGLISSAAAAGLGASVALVESHLLGGDCLNVGCVPSKALLRCARAAGEVRAAAEYGVRIDGDISVDFAAVMARLRRLRAHIAPVDSARRYSEELGVDVFLGRGVFTGRDTIEVNGQTLRFAKAVVATGGTAAIPNIPGLDTAPYFTNASIFNLTERPARLGVIGAGPIGLELAQAFQRLGSQVTVFSRSDRILPKEDPEAADLVRAALARDGVDLVFHARYQRVETGKGPHGVTIVLENDGPARALDFDALLVAAGRKPAVSGLGLETAGVDFDARNGVAVNDRLQTTNPSIYAVGDVASKYQFTHMADFMARLVIRNALFFGRDKVSDLLIPWCTYTEPEVAHVGLYERDLEERAIPYKTFTRTFDHVDRSILEGDTEGFVKVHVKQGSDKIMGATIVGAHAGDLISEITVAMQAGLGLGRLASVIHPYPTTAEAIRQCGDAYNRERLTPTVKGLFAKLMALKR